MPRPLAFWMIACLLISSPLSAQRQVLRGQVLLVDETGATSSAPNVEVTIQETGGTDVADGKGRFRISLPQAFKPGRQITVSVDKQGWAIWQPLEGRSAIPEGLLEIRLLPKGSKKFWTDAFIQIFLEENLEKARLEVKLTDAQKAPKTVDLGPAIKEWAAKYGFSADDVKEQVDRWVADGLEAQDDRYRQALAAFADQKFHTAAQLFSEAGANSEKDLSAISKQAAELDVKRVRLLEETVRNYRNAGDAHSNEYAFAEAIADYQKAMRLVRRDQQPELWAAIQVGLGRANTNSAQHADGTKVQDYLTQAMAAYNAALQIFNRRDLPEYWAAVQNLRGITLKEAGTRADGEEGRKLLAEAAAAHRSTFAFYTPPQYHKQWAMAQSALGEVLSAQAERIAGPESTRLLNQAVIAYIAAMEVFKREQMRQNSAMTQDNIGVALQALSRRASGEESRQLLVRAQAAYKAALEIYTREQFSLDWALVQNNLGSVLMEQGIHTNGSEAAVLLYDAVAAFKSALEVYKPEEYPQNFAMTQDNLGIALHQQGKRRGGAPGVQLMAEAATAHQTALAIYSQKQFPLQWARAQHNLAAAFWIKESLSREKKADACLDAPLLRASVLWRCIPETRCQGSGPKRRTIWRLFWRFKAHLPMGLPAFNC